MMSGAPTAPLWITVLDAAKEWGVPPWEITGDENPVLWFARYRGVRAEVIRAQEKAEKDAKRRR